MTENEAIKRIKECRNTPNFQPYINRILQKIKNLPYVFVAIVRVYLTSRNIVIIAARS